MKYRTRISPGFGIAFVLTGCLATAANGAYPFSYTGSLGTPRFGHFSTLLANGKVLVAGGAIYWGVSTPHAELYNPATATWSNTGILRTERYLHTATLLTNGKVLVAGGGDHNGVILSSAELYNPANGTWSYTGSLGTARTNHTATLLPNGKVLVVGGYNVNSVSLASAELYNPATGTWSYTGSLATGRSHHTATLLPNGKVLATGGIHSDANNNGPMASAELYDPATGAWLPAANLSAHRYDHTATLLTNGMVFIAGGTLDGSFSELYDPARSFINPIISPVKLGDGSFQFHFSAKPGGINLHVLASANAATETPPGSGQFQFTDHQAPNYPQRFYRVSSP